MSETLAEQLVSALVKANMRLQFENADLRAERNSAIAHDTQPYPTAWAYEHVCSALDVAKTERDTMRASREKCSTWLLNVARDLREAGDVPLVHMDQDGVGPHSLTLSGELELIALCLHWPSTEENQ